MVRYEKLTPHYVNPFVDATAAAEYTNGVFGTLSDNGVFTKGSGNCCIMQVEKGDDARYNSFTVKMNEHVRVADLAKSEGEIINITAEELPQTYAVGDVLAPASTGLLAVDSSDDAKGFKIVEVTDYGCRAQVALAETTPMS